MKRKLLIPPACRAFLRPFKRFLLFCRGALTAFLHRPFPGRVFLALGKVLRGRGGYGDSGPMVIAFAVNPGYTHPLMVAISSLLTYNRGPVEVYILSASFPEEMKDRLCSLERIYPNVELHLKLVEDEAFLNLDFHLAADRFSIENYFRLLLPEILQNHDKVLYLDADIVVTGNLRRLWEIGFAGGDHLFAGAKDYWNTIDKIGPLGFKAGELYVNSGVLLMNLRALRAENATAKLVKLASENNFLSADQDAINLYGRGRVIRIPDKYNAQGSTLDACFFVNYHPHVVHYSGNLKPWKPETPQTLMSAYWHAANHDLGRRLAKGDGELGTSHVFPTMERQVKS